MTKYHYKAFIKMALPVQTRILKCLGYSFVYMRNNPYLFPTTLTPDEIAFAGDLATKIENIEAELLENTRDAMATKVADIGLDYNQYIGQTLALQDRLQEQLSDATGVQQYRADDNYNSLAVRNYY